MTDEKKDRATPEEKAEQAEDEARGKLEIPTAGKKKKKAARKAGAGAAAPDTEPVDGPDEPEGSPDRPEDTEEKHGIEEIEEQAAAFTLPKLKRVTPLTVVLIVVFTLCAMGLMVALNLKVVRDYFQGEGIFWVMRIGLMLMLATLLIAVIVREIANTRVVERLLDGMVDVNRRMGLLLDAGREIGSTLELSEILDKILTYTFEVTDTDIGAVYLWEKADNVLRLEVARGVDEHKIMFKSLPMNKGLMGKAAAERETVEVESTSAIDERDNPFFGAAEPASLVLVPLQARGKFLGMLAAASTEANSYGAEEKIMLDGLGELASLSITNAELYRIARKSLDALSKERGVTDSVLEEMVAGVITSDARGRIGTFNREAQRLTGFTFGEKTQAMLKPETSLDQNPLGPLEHGMLDVLHDPRTLREGDAVIMKTDGALLPVSYRIYPLMSGREVIGAACVFMESHVDVAGGGQGRKGPVDYQVLLRSLGARIERVYTHPLAKVIERMGSMTIDDWSRAREDIVRTMEAGYSTLLGLLEDLEQYLNCTTTREWDMPAPYDIAGLTADVVRDLIASPEAEGAAVSVKLSGLPKVFGYERMIKTALEQVIENACIASAPGDRKVEVTGTEEDGFVRVEVTDSGPGISEESRQFIYMPFYTVWEGRSGLGLSMVKRVMQRLGGRTGAEDSSAGAVFFLEFPTAEAARRADAGTDVADGRQVEPEAFAEAEAEAETEAGAEGEATEAGA